MVRTSDEDMASEEHVRTCCEAKILGLASSAGMKKYIIYRVFHFFSFTYYIYVGQFVCAYVKKCEGTTFA